MLRGLVLDYAGVLTDVGGERLLAAVRTARVSGVRTALLSNAAGGPEARRGLTAWFDTLVFSGEVGVAKPDAAVYRLTADRLGVEVGDCVFVDDSSRNVAGAVAAGMVGIRHVSVEDTLMELAALFPVLDSGSA
ncbi:HAD-IA family hydrolase [Saccharomonospora glauca]|jgi:FMN phosphatase YigB (HAD superfamily)|uniref:Haloacid dehalogenase superfamily protein, subfamily IA, variant 3 with third motif having DD or ED n=1 Tax=Saccharomonospora glauca K62 TaxID=928724 RepID=I1D5U6_9PSEU|nr:HAD-IA family hydrolase [Saccharomonospora glauca]EIF00321.1 haloacid dehalogenase superfamily protein, subfamily IA, variant 3 with third motif having DD or ED [Saccharomonospora glauca K62]